jgi:hypothetical protein
VKSIQMMACLGWIGVLALTAAPTFPSDLQEVAKPASKLKARLVAKKDTYKLDLQGKTAAKFRELIRARIEYLGPRNERFGPEPDVPQIEVTLILHNPTDNDIKVILKPGDYPPPPGMTLELKGPGAVMVSSPRGLEAVLYGITPVTIRAGETIEREVLMKWGYSRQFHYAYWLEPGEYTLSVRSSSEGFEGFETEPIKLKVIDK